MEHTNIAAEISKYILNNTNETEQQKQLRQKTVETVEHHHMMTSPEQAAFLSILIKLTKAKNAIEVGVMTGYGSLAIAEALPADGKLIACDQNHEWPSIGKPYWQAAKVSHKIDLRIAPAKSTLEDLNHQYNRPKFDFIFIDADKINYKAYYELSLPILKTGGVIVFDNVISMGKTLVHQAKTPGAIAIKQLCQELTADQRITTSMVPIGSGMLIAMKN